MHEKNHIYKIFLSNQRPSNAAALKTMRQTIQTRLRELKDKWYRLKAEEIQAFANAKNRQFYEAVTMLCGPQPAGTTPLLNADWTKLLTEKSDILNIWAEPFDSVLNRSSSINDQAIERLSKAEIDKSLDNPPCTEETIKAINQLFTNKAPESDALSAEIYKVLGPTSTQKLNQLLSSIWEKKTILQEFKDASIVHGERQPTILRQLPWYLSVDNSASKNSPEPTPNAP